MKNVLVIAYYFPPLGMGGVQRTLKFCKYLPKFGWNPIVVTVKDTAYFSHDPTLLNEVEIDVYRTESLDPLRVGWIFRVRGFESSRRRWSSLLSWFLIPDNKSLWLPFVLRTGRAILKEREISLIFASFPPTTGLIAGCFLKKISNKPLVIDLRDPLGYGSFPPTPLHSWIIEFLNHKIARLADRIILAYPHSEFRWMENKVSVIPNGFDPEDFIESTEKNNRFLIVHTGTLTRRRNALPFLKALKELIESSEIDKNVVKVNLVGWVDPFYTSMIEKEGLSDIVELHPYLSHKESVKCLMRSSLLWLPAGEGEIPGKVYEYLGSKKPIIATLPEGDCAELIRSTNSGVVVEPYDIQGIKRTILNYYGLFLRGGLELKNYEAIERFNKIDQTRALASLFNEIAE